MVRNTRRGPEILCTHQPQREQPPQSLFLQPAFGYEGDPMRLLFEKGFAPTHAFSAFYR